MKMIARLSALLMSALLASLGSASAELYVYAGQAFTNFTVTTSTGPQPHAPYDASNRVTGALVLETALAPNLTNFVIPLFPSLNVLVLSDGINTVSSNEPHGAFPTLTGVVSTDEFGDIIAWAFQVETKPTSHAGARCSCLFDYLIVTSSAIGDNARDFNQKLFCTELDASCFTFDQAASNALAGTWVRVVPEPATWMLMLTAFAVLALARRKRFRVRIGTRA